MQFKEKGILSIILEKAVEILLKKECKKISKIHIDIVSSSIQIIKGIIKKVYIKAEDINYKDILLDKLELEANDVEIILKISKKEIDFKNNLKIDFKISLSENSIKTVLLSESWSWVGEMISKEILNQDSFYDIKIINDQLFIKGLKNKENISYGEELEIKDNKGRIYLESKVSNKFIKIPTENKICIKDINIHNNLINIAAESSVSFE